MPRLLLSLTFLSGHLNKIIAYKIRNKFIIGSRAISAAVSGSTNNKFAGYHYYSSGSSFSKNFKRNNYQKRQNMSYFLIGVSGVTCGGKTTLTKLLQRSFPWSRIVHQDSYFYDDDHSSHVRVPEVENHVNYEILGSMDMARMHKDISAILQGPGEFFDDRSLSRSKNPHQDATLTEADPIPNFDTGIELLKTVQNLEFDSSKYRNIPVLIIEGFIIFESQVIFDACDARFFLTLSKDECRTRRSTRSYNPPDCPGYFDNIVWPEFSRHYNNHINGRSGIKVFQGTEPIQSVWNDSVQIVKCRLDEKYFMDKL
ncbi:nicotinamide riboside kinase 1 [Folsomia candida]|uniref:Nicotinamide riboside kinase 1 n=1 Tax=Folsomia candida TaxID=158441 RepID=A0A226E146_FOLCA|nr:nicotinamide riboside kinase 1 [Folsomia candida]OXA50754.1 Nicotinamide riboside kinase 1 [Folsomia candida]